MSIQTDISEPEQDRDRLAAAIHAAAVAAGIINADQPTTGPQLLLLLQDLTALATRQQPTKLVMEMRDGWIQKINSDHPLEVVILDFDTQGYDEDQKTILNDEDVVATRFRDASVDVDRVGVVLSLLTSTASRPAERAAAPGTPA